MSFHLTIFDLKCQIVCVSKIWIAAIILIILAGCSVSDNQFSGAPGEVKLMTVNPGHFHAALVQKYMLGQVHPTVYVYAPSGADVELHLGRIENFNTREENPTNWNAEVYIGEDYLQRMLSERPGNVVVLAGNNRKKTEYIYDMINEGLHVLLDKPMAIDLKNWEKLAVAFEIAERNNVFIYDIMTERYEVTSNLQRYMARNRGLFGELITGSRENPAIEKSSVHHLFKYVAGEPLRRTPWYFDVEQQGEGIVDVTTHLVDLSMWIAFPESVIDYRKDVEMIDAGRWPTMLTREQFENITSLSQFPDYLEERLKDGVLPYFCNGEMYYTIRGHHVHISVEWDYQAPPGGDDMHYSIVRGTRANLIVRRGEDENFKSTLYVEPAEGVSDQQVRGELVKVVTELAQQYPGIKFRDEEFGFRIEVPDEFYLGHEAHFGKVADAFFRYLIEGKLPHWEVPNMITKYFITTMAREMALRGDGV
jgi:predicted dehydrogenase